MNLVAILFISFFVLCLLGVPVAVSLGASAMLTGLSYGITPLFLVQQMFSMVNSYTLLAIPLFLLVGNIMEHGQITERLVGFASSLVGHIRGGLGQVNVLSNMIMAGISGSANADAAALGSMMIPVMKQEGYPPEMAAAINACASTMGPIIPPSMLMVVYGAYGGVSVAAMFLAGFIPGFFIALFMMITIYHWAKKYPSIKHREHRATAGEIWKAFKYASLALLVPVIIIAGVLGGIFTATESGMVAAVYCLFVTVFVYRRVHLKEFVDIVKTTLISMAAPMFCAAGAGAFGYMIAYLQIPKLILQMSGPINGSHYLTLFFLFFLFMILGCFMDAIPAIMIFLPIVQELSRAAGLDPLHVATLVVVTLCFGFVTPPYGLTMLLSASIAHVPSAAVIKQTIPFYLTFLAVAAIMIFLPEVILFLPNLLMN
ncbi:MAG: C4-dicarboxylate ABC transporter permease [Clostridiales bacterium]|nr:MAG: C4-dicarboxylate ABC transporter permease [Clostridiales bacterium]